jgi:REP element-mobilizing transposase RayT
MPRKPRIHFPGAVYHVMLRGNAGEPIFFEDGDRYRLYLFLQQATEKFRCRIHGFCFMTNHIHLIMQVADVPLSRIMQSLALRYTKWINYSQNRTGHVFQSRYKAILLDADAYLLELVRYVHLNPVRAGMVTAPEQHPWSGHRTYTGAESLSWLTTDWVLARFSNQAVRARQAYQEFVAKEADGGSKTEFHNGNVEGMILGEDRFAEEALRTADLQRRPDYSLDNLIGVVCRSYSITADQFRAPGKQRPFSEARALAAWLVQESPHLSLVALGRLVKRDISPLGRAGRRLAKRAGEDETLRKRAEEVMHRLKMAERQT